MRASGALITYRPYIEGVLQQSKVVFEREYPELNFIEELANSVVRSKDEILGSPDEPYSFIPIDIRHFGTRELNDWAKAQKPAVEDEVLTRFLSALGTQCFEQLANKWSEHTNFGHQQAQISPIIREHKIAVGLSVTQKPSLTETMEGKKADNRNILTESEAAYCLITTFSSALSKFGCKMQSIDYTNSI